MGRLEIQIRHGGHNPRPSGAVITLAVLIVLAVAGGAGHHALDGIAHTVLTVAEIAACTVGALAAAALAVVIVLAAARARRALANRPRPVHVQSTRLDDAAVRPAVDDPADPGRPALDAARTRRAGWPLAGQLPALPLDDRHDDDPGR